MALKKVIVTGGSGFIGIHLIELLLKENYEVVNFDIRKPINNQNLKYYRHISLTQKDLLRDEVLRFDPNFIIHLAAVTEQNSNSLSNFRVNIEGSRNLLEVTNELTQLEKFVFVSSQYVNTPGCTHSENLEELTPYGFYGESKLLGEKMTAGILQSSHWTIIRPTTIWGPYHNILGEGLWKEILMKRYFHPRNDQVVKAYGYVKNTAWQISRIMEIDNILTDRKVFYLGDENISQDKWVAAFVSHLTNKKMRRLPKFIFLVLSEFGEILRRFGITFPLYRSRYRNLITSNPSPLVDALELFGPSPISFKVAIDETCAWVKQIHDKSRKVE
jgi:nucleoside-diphosphate-sugar epimerase